ncbi:hypothetical protein EX191_23285 [Vibrio chemaguriensis]|uniref:Uncharacterized protein n=1 Tax=Vibrio chemaguriensis TaxID=2527672 RepID=A0ABX1I5L9_9VIBR|nr:hypothetical protein [Vibrio chemaguriensis]
MHKSSLLYNAALRGEQRIPPKLNHCAVNTKADSNQNCQALGTPLECFVSWWSLTRSEELSSLCTQDKHFYH